MYCSNAFHRRPIHATETDELIDIIDSLIEALTTCGPIEDDEARITRAQNAIDRHRGVAHVAQPEPPACDA